MFARILAIVSLVAFAVADAGQCNTGNIQCCESATTVQKYNANAIKSGLATIPTDVTGLVGLECSPLIVVAGGAGCEASQEPMCCSNEEYNGVVNVGCSPISL
ncbi:fungal hydrophobin [Suillus bovinus]|uniref:fungal hydrophobin n=1 Tax=Suillus bovinus TaxID=48563 RepID=UPI001B85E169|nr:fungal hydrophobin [Suillus bovinus]KAG2143528.1 fungal hydrophobin [Suillus bovinus]